MIKPKQKKLVNITRVFLSSVLFFQILIPLNSQAETVYNGGDADVDNLQQQIQDKQSKIKELTDKIDQYNSSIKTYKNQAVSLSSQVNYLGARIEKTEAEIELTENQISENALQIQDTENKIKQNKSEIEKNQKFLREFLQEIYKHDQKSELEIILANDSISNYYNELRAISILQNKVTEQLGDLKEYKSELGKHVLELETKKESLKTLRDKLDKNKDLLEEQIITKQNILSQTRNSEYRFQSLLSQVKSEQASINSEIANLEQIIRQKLTDQGVDALAGLGNATFIYPVPNRGITAYFHDPDYPFRYIFEHPAIDLRATQSTQIRASSAGYVGRVQWNTSTNYGYIMIIHADGFSSVYGHISKPFVKEDQYVSQGEVIALSGGMPGTPGSGRLSTGPHLHFEIRKNGIPVNPLNYLP